MLANRIVMMCLCCITCLGVLAVGGCEEEDEHPPGENATGGHVKTNWSADPAQLYGFDDHDPAKMRWKSVKEGETDTVVATIVAAAEASHIYLVSPETSTITVATDPATNPVKLSASPQTVKISGVANAKGTAYVWARYNSATGGPNGKLGVKVYGEKHLKVAVIPVGLTGGPAAPNFTAANATTLEANLNDIYRQCVVTWEVHARPAVTVAWDSDKNGTIKVSAGLPFFGGYGISGEMKKIRNAAKDTDYHHNLFLISAPFDALPAGGGTLLALHEPPGRYGWVSSTAWASSNWSWIMAHELGHGAGGLADLYTSTATNHANLTTGSGNG